MVRKVQFVMQGNQTERYWPTGVSRRTSVATLEIAKTKKKESEETIEGKGLFAPNVFFFFSGNIK